jgi:hypothetical protein
LSDVEEDDVSVAESEASTDPTREEDLGQGNYSRASQTIGLIKEHVVSEPLLRKHARFWEYLTTAFYQMM